MLRPIPEKCGRLNDSLHDGLTKAHVMQVQKSKIGWWEGRREATFLPFIHSPFFPHPAPDSA